MQEWYEKHFQEDYLKVYDHRDEQKAARELEAVMEYIPLKRGQQALDLCCGNGRHCRWLARRGVKVTGVDLSAVLLKKAIDLTTGLHVQYMRSDVRNVSFYEEFDAVFNLFTSFGYFSEDEENEEVFKRANEALKPHGVFVFDYLNPTYVREHLVPEDESEKNGMYIKQKRQITNDYVMKKITITDQDSTRTYEEKVKLYSNETLTAMLEQNGFEVNHSFGDYTAVPFDERHSPRQLFICKKIS